MKVSKNIQQDFQDELNRTLAYVDALERFKGAEDKYYNGVVDDYFNIKKLINDVGDLVLNAEQEAELLKKKAERLDDDYMNEDLFYDRITYLSYRQHTYKALFFLTFTICENRFFEFARIINEHVDIKHPNQINIDSQGSDCKNYLTQIFRVENQNPDFKIENLFADINYYAEVRNALTHRTGLSKEKKNAPNFKKWVAKTNGIELRENETGEGVIIITHSQFILDYFQRVKWFFDQLIIEAEKLTDTFLNLEN